MPKKKITHPAAVERIASIADAAADDDDSDSD